MRSTSLRNNPLAGQGPQPSLEEASFGSGSQAVRALIRKSRSHPSPAHRTQSLPPAKICRLERPRTPTRESAASDKSPSPATDLIPEVIRDIAKLAIDGLQKRDLLSIEQISGLRHRQVQLGAECLFLSPTERFPISRESARTIAIYLAAVKINQLAKHWSGPDAPLFFRNDGRQLGPETPISKGLIQIESHPMDYDGPPRTPFKQTPKALAASTSSHLPSHARDPESATPGWRLMRRSALDALQALQQLDQLEPERVIKLQVGHFHQGQPFLSSASGPILIDPYTYRKLAAYLNILKGADIRAFSCDSSSPLFFDDEGCPLESLPPAEPGLLKDLRQATMRAEQLLTEVPQRMKKIAAALFRDLKLHQGLNDNQIVALRATDYHQGSRILNIPGSPRTITPDCASSLALYTEAARALGFGLFWKSNPDAPLFFNRLGKALR
jgi:hypothetical protein